MRWGTLPLSFGLLSTQLSAEVVSSEIRERGKGGNEQETQHGRGYTSDSPPCPQRQLRQRNPSLTTRSSLADYQLSATAPLPASEHPLLFLFVEVILMEDASVREYIPE